MRNMAAADKGDARVPDPMAAAGTTGRTPPARPDPHSDISSEVVPTASNLEKQESLGAQRLRTQTTAYSDDTEFNEVGSDGGKTLTKRKWYKRLNPLKRSRKPPIPHERTVVPEYKASFWSLLTFQWIGPLMRVSVVASILAVLLVATRGERARGVHPAAGKMINAKPRETTWLSGWVPRLAISGPSS